VDTKRSARLPGPARVMTAAVVAVVGIVVVVMLVALLRPFGWSNPFSAQRTERPNSVVLAQLIDESRYVAASGTFQTVLDVEEDTPWVPGFVKGERSVFIAEGNVEGSVDFSKLTEDAIQASPDGEHVTVHVPQPQLSPPRLDPAATRLVSRDRGIVDRVGDALSATGGGDQQALYQRAQQKVAEAAEVSDLRARSRQNTEQFLRTLLQGLGYKQVDVVWDGADPAAGR
jgi:hypothetical protein